MTGRFTPEQRDAVERRGRVFVSAGAGTGKTAVLVERVLRRFREGTPIDRLLAITFTDRSASELRRRVREGLELAGEMEQARSVDSAWISTIHRFCLRILRAHAFEAGLDPRFGIADDVRSGVLLHEAFDIALERFLAERSDQRLDLLATYGRRRLRPMILDAHARLRSAGRPLALRPFAQAELDGAIASARTVAAGVDRDEAAALVARLDAGAGAAELADLSDYRLRNVAAHQELNAAREQVEQAARDVLAAADLAELDRLLRMLDASYRELKDARSLVDFADLELRARDLLTERPELAESYRERFASVLVDEFQDTNRLQCELVDLVAGGELFLVGDEFQSIYRFRHADVEVYRERRTEAGDGRIQLRRNHRSRPHVIAAVNEVFGRDFGDRYTPLLAEARHEGAPPAGGRVEILLTDKLAFRQVGESWREAEARALAARIGELVDAGECLPGQVVLLFEAGTDAARYEAALREHHLRTVRTTGRGYYATQQVSDLLAYLRLLRNRYDDVALLTVLASPLVGMSNDGLLRVRRAAVKRPIFTAFERDDPPPGLAPAEQRMALAFAQRFARLVKRSGEVSLERLCELIVAEHDYDLACLAMADGDRRYANLRKLSRLAAEFEAVRGPDLEGFIRFCDEQATLAAREGEAAIAEEGRDAIVLMTVHAAKGLEFDVVVLADQGRERMARHLPDILVSADGRAAIKAPDPAGGLRPALGYAEAAARERAAEREEGRRLQYVAMTRARQHLIVSGALDPGEQTSIAEVCRLLEVGLDEDGDVDRGAAALTVRVTRPAPGPPGGNGAARPAVVEAAPAGGEVGAQLALFVDGGRSPEALPPLVPIPAPAPVALRRLSYSALSLYRRCGYRYFAQRVLGLPEPVAEVVEGEGLGPLELGDAVHLELERADGRWRDLYPHATDADTERIAAFVAAWAECPLRGRVEALAAARPEVPFAFEVDGVLFRGRFDVFGREADGAALVVDFKTNRLEERAAQDVMDRSYGVQVTTYALAALRTGAPSVEVAYAFLEDAKAVAQRRFEAADAGALEAELRDAIDAIRAGRFPARPGPHCQECPALDLLCAGPRLEWQG
ncbi:MAG TPA: UvrD-helicase domain-containing protein [Gaiellales bacterium]|nr:UvrD-helicase domain-containing protein [Gaiellales bacterium]